MAMEMMMTVVMEMALTSPCGVTVAMEINNNNNNMFIPESGSIMC